MIATEALKAKKHLRKNPNLWGHHTSIECGYSELTRWATQLELPIFITSKGWTLTYKEVYLGKFITITLKAEK